MEDEEIHRALREDAHIMFENAVKNNAEKEVKNIFKLFIQNKDSSFLVSHVMQRSEEMLLAFSEGNFSNPEIGAFFKLRKSRSTQYRNAFQSFQRNGNHAQLVNTLKEAIEEHLTQSSNQHNTELSDQNSKYLARARSNEDKNDEIFKMAYQTDFSKNDYGKILKQAYEEDKDHRVVSIIESYLSHNDYLQLKNDLVEFAKVKQGEDASANMYTSLPQAIDCFVRMGNFTEDEGQSLKQLAEQKHRQLTSIWRVYEAIKQQDDMLHSLKVFMDIKMKHLKNGVSDNKAAEAPVQKVTKAFEPRQEPL